MVTITTEQRRTLLARRHNLATPAVGPAEIAEQLVGLHSSDPVSVYLSCQARVHGFTREQLDDALYDERVLVRVLGMRRTLFVVPAGLSAALHAGCSSRYVSAEQKRLVKLLSDQHGFDEVWLEGVKQRTLEAIADIGEPTARQLTQIVPELSTKITFGEGKTWGGEVGVSTRVLFLLATEGHILRARPMGSWLSSQYRWVRSADWLTTTPDPLDAATARAELTRRWLAAYGPATFTDLKWWSGWGVGDTRNALAAVGAVSVGVEDGEAFMLDEPDDDDPDDWAALLPSLDPTPMGWKERDWFVGPHAAELFDRNGNIGPTVWLNGRIVGGWAVTETGEIRLGILESIGGAGQSLIDNKAEALQQWIGSETFTPRFRTPLEKRLIK